MSRYFIVMNESRTEGFVSDDIRDVEHAAGQRTMNPSSDMAEAFREAYASDGQELKVEPWGQSP
ncbi:MAG: hypothetical protein RSG92_15265 [Pseudomonas sp.]